MSSLLQARISELLEKMRYWEAHPSNLCFEVSVDDWLAKSHFYQKMFFSLGCISALTKTDLPRPRSAFEWFSNFNVDMSQEWEAHGEVFLLLIAVHMSDSLIQIAASQLIWRKRMSLGVIS